VTAIVTRAEALARDLPQYFTGKPCCRGHIANRYSGSSTCVECSSMKMSRWNKDNGEKRSRAGRLYYQANIERIRERSRERQRKRHRAIADLLAILKTEMPDLLDGAGL
jgi:hypothetical protein